MLDQHCHKHTKRGDYFKYKKHEIYRFDPLLYNYLVNDDHRRRALI